MKIRGWAGLVALGIFGLLIACERSSLDYAGKTSDDNRQPPYQQSANPRVSAVSNDTFVRAVLPQGDEAPDGQAVYAKSCVACHQMGGQGIPGVFPPLVGTRYVISDNTERLAAIIMYGLQGPITVKGVQYNSVMTPWGGLLNDAELAAVANYVRNSWGNSASEVSPELFASVRQKYGTRPPFTIQELGEEP